MDVEKIVLLTFDNATKFTISLDLDCGVPHTVTVITTSRIGTFTLPYLAKGISYEVSRND